MKTTLILILGLLIFQIAYSQEISKEEILKHGIETITVVDADGKRLIEFFNEKGVKVKAGEIEKDGTFILNEEYLYNASGQLDEVIRYNTEDGVHSTKKHQYNAQGQLIKAELFDGAEVDITWTYTYDTAGNRIKETTKSGTSGNSVTVYQYDSNSYLTQEDKSNNTIGKEEKVNYKYNDRRQLIEKKTKDYFSGTTITQSYEYNNEGKLKQLKDKSSNGVSMVIDYAYDEKGLLVSDTWKGSLSKEAYTTLYVVKKK
ncbi:hypothetical protein TH63_19475 [Rufibacter radiotolerans]|uniref:YD repeat-containing protein n=1 Tax=Rufibacter radiotolerans TaxID=1379910 RepID=A0A0H4VTR0_9BACT|nr:hypothetical protein [Rufibacter radiotolerans]AKQ47332.1 hypothetical protein TH63_19475 [Rufibacter radiotolerans]